MTTITCDSFTVPPKALPVVQCELRNGPLCMTTWLDKHPKLKEGAYVTLRFAGDTKWRVAKIYPQVHSAQDFDVHRKWDNNNYDKHKGLGLEG